MNKNDFKLIITLILISIIFLLSFNLFKTNKNKKAIVYYENEKILEINLQETENKVYKVKGYNGEVLIELKDNKVQVIQENSPLHLCSKQGYISESYETIVCLPNKIIVTIEEDNKIDTVVR